MKIWRVHLRPDADDIDPVDVCIRQKVVGIGWRLSERPTDKDKYWELGEKEYGYQGWSRAVNAIGWRMEEGDLVWVRGFLGTYYLGKIEGDWEYRDDPENLKADIINVRPSKLYRVGTNVAGKIVNCFRPSATVQQIHDKTAELFSIVVYKKITHEQLPITPPDNIDIFSLLSDVDLEDVVGIYLQQKKGLLFLPSSRSRQNTTISYEYQLIDPKTGHPVFVQVKSGNTILNPSTYYKFPEKYYLFSPAGYASSSEKEHVVCIEKREIDAFLRESRSYLPLNITVWLEFKEELENTCKKKG